MATGLLNSLLFFGFGTHNISSADHWEHKIGILVQTLSAVMATATALHFFFPRTAFTDSDIEHRTLFRGTQRVSYVEIRRVKLGGSSFYHAVHIFIGDGRQLNITGTLDQVTRAEQIIRERMPHLQSNTFQLH